MIETGRPASARVFRTETVIDAPPERVWDVLVDFRSWDSWNPTLFSADRAPRQGEEVRMKLQLGRLKVPMRQEIRKMERPHELTWRSRQLVPAAFDVIRSFRLERLEDGRTRLVQTETGAGFLAGPIFRLIGKPVLKGYEDLGRALARRMSEGKA